MLRKAAITQLPDGYDVDTHFAPSYNPWDQRMCLVPDGDLFTAIREGRASVVTDHIDTFTESGIKLASGVELAADIVVSATGLNLLAIGGMELDVDGRPVELSKTVSYKGMMLSDVPNFAWTIGYTNASWTLKADLVAQYVCRLLAHMDRHGYAAVTPDASRVTAQNSLPRPDVGLRAAQPGSDAKAGRPTAVATSSELRARRRACCAEARSTMTWCSPRYPPNRSGPGGRCGSR